MNQQRYRLIYNKARGILMVVAESANSHSRSDASLGRCLAPVAICARFILTPGAVAILLLVAGTVGFLPYAEAQIVADRSAPGNQRPTVLNAANGVPLVNIQTPSAAGVSRNTYSQFDVHSNGVILNNARTNTQSQLGGWVQGNPWLATGSARVILNEVNSSNPSYIKGYVEVAGSRAEVVIANPSGINVAGGGFINASRVTLTTGIPRINAAGGIDAYSVCQGQIEISGQGLDTATADYTDLIARNVQLNAGLWAKTLKVTTGANQVDAANSTATPIAGSGATPAFAIDSSELGGMYANQITLLGTDKGLGVRHAGQIGASAGDVVVNVDGSLSNAGKLTSTGQTQLDTSGSIDNSGTIYAGGTTRLSTLSNITNSGTIAAQGDTALLANGPSSQINSLTGSLVAAGLHPDGTLADTGTLTVTATAGSLLNGQLVAGGGFTASGSQLNLTGAQISAGSLNLTATAGDIDASLAQLSARDTLTAHTAQTLRTDGASLSANQLDLQAHDLSNIGGSLVHTGSGTLNLAIAGGIDNTQGVIAANAQNPILNTTVLNNTDGQIRHTGSGQLDISATQSIDNTRGLLATNQQLQLATPVLNNTDGTLQAVNGNATLTVDQLDNTRGAVYTGQDLHTMARTVTNSGSFYAAGAQQMDASGSVTNTGVLAAQGNTTIAAQTLDSSGTIAAGVKSDGTQAANGDLTVNAGNTLVATGLNLAAGQLDMTGSSLDLSGSQTGAANVSLTATQGNITTSGATVASTGRLKIEAQAQSGQTLVNQGGTVSAQALDFKLAQIDNSGGTIAQTGTGDLAISTGNLVNRNGVIAANANNLSLTSNALDNQTGQIRHAGTGTLAVTSSGALDNTQGAIGSNGHLDLQADVLTNDSGAIGAQQLSLQANSVSNRSGQITQSGSAATTLTIANALDNTGGSIAGNGDLSLSAKSLNNQDGTIQAAGSASAPASLSVSIADALDNTRGRVQASKNTTVGATQLTNAQGLITAEQDLTLAAHSLNGNGQVLAGRDAGVALDNDYTHTAGNEIAANRNLSLSTAGAFTNEGTLQAGNKLSIQAVSILNDNADHSSSLLAGGQLSTNSTTFTNAGSVIAGTISIKATTSITNSGPQALIGATDSTGTLELLAPVIHNRDDVTATDVSPQTTILGLGKVVLAGGKDANGATTAATQILNQSALIQSGGDLDVQATTLTNTRRVLTANAVYTDIASTSGNVVWTDANPNVPGGRYIEPPHGGQWNSLYLSTDYTTTVSRNGIAQISPEAQILVGGNFTPVVTTLQNYWSKVSAVGNIVLNNVSLDQDSWRGAPSLQERTTSSGVYNYRTYKFIPWTNGWGPQVTYTPVTSYESSFSANGNLGGSGNSINNPGSGNPANLPGLTAVVGPTTASASASPFSQQTGSTARPSAAPAASAHGVALTLPTSSLYHLNTSPTSHYLVESNPAFANRSRWMGSDAYLNTLAADPNTIQKRLGDNYYEQQLVRDQIQALTGNTIAAGYADAQAQFEQMYAEGARVAKALDLPIGASLSAEQAAALTGNVTILEAREVDTPSGKQQVLVPVVYLAHVTAGDLHADGAFIAGNNINLNNTKAFTNQGAVVAKNTLSIAMAKDARLDNTGGTLLAGGAMQLSTANSDIDLTSAQVKAGDLAIVSGKDLILNTASRERTSSTAISSRTQTDLGQIARIDVANKATITTAGDLTQNAGQIAVGGNLNATIGGDYNLGTVAQTDQQSTDYRRGKSTVKADINRVTQLTSSVTVGGNAAISAGQDITALGATIDSGGDLALNAGRDLNLLAARNTKQSDIAASDSRRGLISGRTTKSESHEQSTDIVGTTISGNNVTLVANRDANLEAAQVKAADKLAVGAGNNVNIVSAEQTKSSQSQVETIKTSGPVGKKSVKTTLDTDSVKQIGSSLSGNSIDVVTSNTLTLSASTLDSPGNIKLSAGNQINYLAATNLDERHETVEKKNNLLSHENFSGFYDSAWQRDKVNSETSSSTRTAAVSQVQSQADVLSQSGGDTTLQGTKIKAGSFTATAGSVNGQVVDPQAKLNLQGVKESTTTSHTESGHSFMWQTMAGQGGTHETLKMPEILLISTVNPENSAKTKSESEQKPELNATGGIVVDAVSLPGTSLDAKKASASSSAGDSSAKGPATTIVDLKAQAQDLAKQPGMAWLADLTKRDDVDWKTVQLVHDNWDYKHSGLTPEGGIVVAIVVTILTMGWSAEAGAALATEAGMTAAAGTAGASTVAAAGAGVVGSGVAAGTVLTTTGAAVAAATSAAITTLASQAAVSLINNKGDVGKTLKDLGSDENVKQLLTSMLTAGALQAVGGTTWMQQFAGTGITDRLVTQMVNSAVSATVQTAVMGGDYEKNLSNALLTGGVNAAAGWAASGIGDWYGQNDLAGKYVAHKVAHALVGCAGAAAKGGDCASGAIGAAVGEAFAEMAGQNAVTDVQKSQLLQLSRLVAMASAKAAGKDWNAAGDAALVAVANNFLMHSEAKKLADLKQQRQACTVPSDCASLDQQIREIQLTDAQRDEQIKQACANPASASCATWNSFLQVAKDSYKGQNNYDPNGIIAQEQKDVANLAFLYNQRVQHPAGYDLGKKALVGLAGAAVAALGVEVAAACFANLPTCIPTLNALADGLLADGAVGAAGYTGSKLAAQQLKEAVTVARAELPMSGLVDDLIGKTITSPSLSKTAQTMANDGKLGEQLAYQALKEETGRDFRPLQNASGNGPDGVSIVTNADGSKVIYVAEVKSSVNGVDKAASAEGNPAEKLEKWADLAADGKGTWANLSAADQAFALELQSLIRQQVPVKGIQVQVGIPRAGQNGTPVVKFGEWK